MRIFSYILYLFWWPFWLLQYIIPKNEKVWVLGAWYGNKFSDNSKYLYTYLQGLENILPIWISRRKEIVAELRKQGGKAYYVWSAKGIYYMLIARYIAVSSGKMDVNPFFGNGAVWIQLWHGSPMKKIGFDDAIFSNKNRKKAMFIKKVFPFISEYNYHYIISSAKFFNPIFSRAFLIDEKKVLETGYPRNDAFTEKRTDNEYLQVLYLPTFRSKGEMQNIFEMKDFNIPKFNNFLRDNKIKFLYKFHYQIYSEGKREEEKYSNLEWIQDLDFIDVYKIMNEVDALITDYSGCYFDFLLTEKPIINAAFDLKNYIEKSRELYFEYEKLAGDSIVKNQEELQQELLKIKKGLYNDKNILINNRLYNTFHSVKGGNSQRVYEAIKQQCFK